MNAILLMSVLLTGQPVALPVEVVDRITQLEKRVSELERQLSELKAVKEVPEVKIISPSTWHCSACDRAVTRIREMGIKVKHEFDDGAAGGGTFPVIELPNRKRFHYSNTSGNEVWLLEQLNMRE